MPFFQLLHIVAAAFSICCIVKVKVNLITFIADLNRKMYRTVFMGNCERSNVTPATGSCSLDADFEKFYKALNLFLSCKMEVSFFNFTANRYF
jgi:hypothetical protein